jgi:hypothetical protein
VGVARGVLGALLSQRVGVVRGVMGALSSRHVGVAASGVVACGCCSCRCHAARGVMGAIVTPYGSCSHHASSLSSPLIEGSGGPSRERRPCISARRQYLAAKENVSKEIKRKRREKSYR